LTASATTGPGVTVHARTGTSPNFLPYPTLQTKPESHWQKNAT
jgi:hypothetical protein